MEHRVQNVIEQFEECKETIREILDQIRYYRYMKEVQKCLIEEKESEKTKIVCDLLDTVVEVEKVDVLFAEINAREYGILFAFKQSLRKLLLLPDYMQKELWGKEYSYNPMVVEKVAKHMDEFVYADTPFEALESIFYFMAEFNGKNKG